MITLGHPKEESVGSFFNASGISDTPPNAAKPLQIVGKNKYGNAYIDANKKYWSIQNRTHSGNEIILDLFWMDSKSNPVGGSSTGTVSGAQTGSHSSLGLANFSNATGNKETYDNIEKNINWLIDSITNNGANSGYTARQMADFVKAKKMASLGILQINELLTIQAVASGDKNQALVNAYNAILSNPQYNQILLQNKPSQSSPSGMLSKNK